MTDEPAASQPLRREPAEEFCLALLLRHPELRHEGSDLSPELFLLGEHHAILSAWTETPEIEPLRQALPSPLHAQLDRILAKDLPVLEGAQLRAAFHDCVRRIEVRRLSAAKRASAAALTDPDVQQYMSAAVEQAVALQGAEPSESAPGIERDTRAAELAVSLIEDSEMGRRLHQTSAEPQPAEAAQQSEGER